MHSEFANYLPELGQCDLFLMHVQRVLIACFVCCCFFFCFVLFFFCICNFMGTDSGTNIQGRPGVHIALLSTHKGFLELCHTPACNIPHSNLAPNSPAITAAFSLQSFCFWHLFICYTVLMLWILPFQRKEMMLRGDTNTLQCRNL